MQLSIPHAALPSQDFSDVGEFTAKSGHEELLINISAFRSICPILTKLQQHDPSNLVPPSLKD